MDQFKLQILINQLVVDPNVFSKQAFQEQITALSKDGPATFSQKLMINYHMRQATIMKADKELRDQLRTLFPWYRTGSGGR